MKTVYFTSVSAEVALLDLSQSLSNSISANLKRSLFSPSIKYLLNLAIEKFTKTPTDTNQLNFISIDDFLTYQNYQVSRLLTETCSVDMQISDANLFDEGYWEFEFNLKDINIYDVVFYQFDLQISDANDFSNILINKNSEADNSNWTYEKEINDFQPLPTEGISGDYVDRRIKYISKLSEYLERGAVYYVRYRQKYHTTSEKGEFYILLQTGVLTSLVPFQFAMGIAENAGIVEYDGMTGSWTNTQMIVWT
jgi:hypothetical protein